MIKAADLLRSARRRAGLTQRALARHAGVPQPTIAAIERGHQDPRYRTLSRLLRACGYDLDFNAVAGQGIDRTLIQRLIRLTPGERLRTATGDARVLHTLSRARIATHNRRRS